jgi:hypothetical protein
MGKKGCIREPIFLSLCVKSIMLSAGIGIDRNPHINRPLLTLSSELVSLPTSSHTVGLNKEQKKSAVKHSFFQLMI